MILYHGRRLCRNLGGMTFQTRPTLQQSFYLKRKLRRTLDIDGRPKVLLSMFVRVSESEPFDRNDRRDTFSLFGKKSIVSF